jgi:aspartate aminotransferase
MNFSKRVLSMETSPVRKLIPHANKAKALGKKVYHLNIGQPDIKTPELFYSAIRNYNEEVLSYAPSEGIKELIDALINYYKEYDMSFNKEEILITNGGSEALLFTLMALFDVGDEILIPEPFYANYNSMLQILEIKVSPIKTKVEDGFHLPEKEVIEKCISEKTKAILISNPGNPTGTTYTKQEIDLLAQIAKEKDLFIISDEVYREFVYDKREYVSFGSIEAVKDRVVLIDSISKRYSACGARIGSILSKNKEFIAQVYKLCQARLSVPTLEQVGAAALYSTPKTYLQDVNREYEKRRDVIYEALSNIKGVVCRKPEGAFYCIVKLPVDDSEKFIIWLLQEFDVDGETLMMASANGFYGTKNLGVDEVRISYCLNEGDLKKAMNILQLALIKYPGRK